MKTKKSFSIFMISVITGIIFLTSLFVGCRKNEILLEEIPIENKTTNLIKDWLQAERIKAKDLEKISIDSILSESNWSKGYKYKINSQQSLLYIPFINNSNISLNVFLNEQNNKIDSGNIAVIKHNAVSQIIKNHGVVFVNFLKQLNSEKIQNNNFTGSIVNYSITNKFKNEFGFKKDKIWYAKFILPKSSSNSTTIGGVKTQARVCYHYYWVTNNWETGIQHWEYLSSHCFEDGGCPTTTSIVMKTGNQVQKNSCGSDNQNGGSPGPAPEPGNESCSMSQNDAAEVMSNIAIDAVSTVTGLNGASETLSSGRIERPAIRTLEFCRLTFPFPFYNVVYYGANYSGKQYKNNSSDQTWKWDNLTYSGFGQVKGTIPTCFDVQLSVTAAAPVIDSDKTKASVLVTYSGQYKLTCAFGWQIGQVSGTSPSSFNASQQFD